MVVMCGAGRAGGVRRGGYSTRQAEAGASILAASGWSIYLSCKIGGKQGDLFDRGKQSLPMAQGRGFVSVVCVNVERVADKGGRLKLNGTRPKRPSQKSVQNQATSSFPRIYNKKKSVWSVNVFLLSFFCFVSFSFRFVSCHCICCLFAFSFLLIRISMEPVPQ